MEYHPEDLMSLMRRSLVLKLLLKDSSPKMARAFGVQYLIMYMAEQFLQMSAQGLL